MLQKLIQPMKKNKTTARVSTKLSPQPLAQSPAQPTSPSEPAAQWCYPLDISVLAGLSLLMFFDVFLDADVLLSQLGADLSGQFLAWREFGFSQLRSGHLALWNPYVFSGAPYVGGFQSGMFYPPNLLHLILPTNMAINALIALHIFLTGAFMYLWARRRGLVRLAAITSGALLMFCGAGFLHIYAGHLPNLCVMPWVPLLFLSIDGYFDTRQLKWLLLGMATTTMLMLAGHPQYVFFTGVAAGIYVCLRLVREPKRASVAAGLLVMVLGAVALSAVQLWTGFDAASESVRSRGLPYSFAAIYSFPPENLLTLLVPGFFGDLSSFPYWGRWFLWEMCLFFGITGLVLAIYGAYRGNPQRKMLALPMALILVVLALGSYLPLFKWLYDYVPGFNLFRGQSKFVWQASVFLTLLAGIGLDALLRQTSSAQASNRLVWPVLGGATALLIASLALPLGLGTGSGDHSWWQGIIANMMSTRESFIEPVAVQDAEFLLRSIDHAAGELFKAAAVMGVLAGLLYGARRARWPLYGLAVLAILEVFAFSHAARATFDRAQTRMPELERIRALDPSGDYRIFNQRLPNSGVLTKVPDIWGDDPSVSLRYAEFMAHTQHQSPDSATQDIQIGEMSKLLRMLRLKYVLPYKNGQAVPTLTLPSPMVRAQLMDRVQVVQGRDNIFKAMDAEDFDPTQTVILEAAPPVALNPGVAHKGMVRILSSSTDATVFQVDLPAPAVLLVTDVWSKNWHAQALEGSTQSSYSVMPANYTLIGIPLAAGHHHFQLAYTPAAFQIGKWVSIVSLLLFFAALGWDVMRRRKATPTEPSPA